MAWCENGYHKWWIRFLYPIFCKCGFEFPSSVLSHAHIYRLSEVKFRRFRQKNPVYQGPSACHRWPHWFPHHTGPMDDGIGSFTPVKFDIWPTYAWPAMPHFQPVLVKPIIELGPRLLIDGACRSMFFLAIQVHLHCRLKPQFTCGKGPYVQLLKNLSWWLMGTTVDPSFVVLGPDASPTKIFLLLVLSIDLVPKKDKLIADQQA